MPRPLTATFVLFLAATAAGCGSMSRPFAVAPPLRPASLSAPTCTGHESPVTINRVTIISSTEATIQLNPGQRDIPIAGGGIRWKFSGSGYLFTTSDGVSFANYSTNPSAGPGLLGVDNNGKEFVVCFGDTSKTSNSTWNYAIKFYAEGTSSPVWLCDPTIVNSSVAVAAVLTVACTVAPL